MSWFSAKIRRVCLVDGVGCTMSEDSIYLLRASDFESALARAISIGHQQEEEYHNADGNLVRWKLREILTLDVIPTELLDGIEIQSELTEIEPPESLSIDTSFQPEGSIPKQTI